MALRGLAGDMARNTAGVWKAVAEAVDPRPPEPAPEPVVEPESSEPVIDIEAGQMIVPIDAWTRILEQVGHVHEAGQQLADARERAARAETENVFLKEQLRDIKAQRQPRRPAAPAAPAVPVAGNAPAAEPESKVTAPVSTTVPVATTRVRRLRHAASRWLSPK